jgi:hypothetical protein
MQGRMQWKHIAGIVLVFSGFAAWTAPEAARVRGSLVVELTEPFAVQGHTYVGGRLVLRDLRDFTPGVAMHEVAVDGDRLGVVMARRGKSEVEQTASAALFRRDRESVLHLIGYVREGRDTYRLVPEPAGATGELVVVKVPR